MSTTDITAALDAANIRHTPEAVAMLAECNAEPGLAVTHRDAMQAFVGNDGWLATDLIAAHPHMPETKAMQARIAELEAQIERLTADKAGLVEALDAVWKFAAQMRNATKLVGPYPNDEKANRIWARSLYHQGKDLHTLLKPARAALEQHGDEKCKCLMGQLSALWE